MIKAMKNKNQDDNIENYWDYWENCSRYGYQENMDFHEGKAFKLKYECKKESKI